MSRAVAARRPRPPQIKLPNLELPASASFATGPNADRPVSAATIREVNELARQAAAGFTQFKAGLDTRLDELDRAYNDLSSKVSASRMNGGGSLPGLPRVDKSTAAKDMRGFLLAQLSLPGGVSASLRKSSNPDGGYLVPDTVEQALENMARDLTPMRRIARVVQTDTGNFIRHIAVGTSGAVWTGETTAPTDTEVKSLHQIELVAKEITAQPKATRQLFEDSRIDIGAFISEQIAEEFAVREGEAFWRGTGALDPNGILTYGFSSQADGTRAWGSWQYVPSGAASSLLPTSDDDENPADAIIQLVHELKDAYAPNAVFVMNKRTAGTVRRLKHRDGSFLWQDSLQKGTPSKLLGFDVVIDPHADDIGADKYPIAFGDFGRGYIVLDRIGTTLLVDPYTDKPFVKYYTRKRVGGGASGNFDAIKFLKIASS